MKILSIIVPCYNVVKYLNRLIDSLVSCKRFYDLQIIIVNDGSTDNTLEIALKYEHTYPNNIKTIDKIDEGYGSTINTAIEYVSAKYVKVIDGDDWVNTQSLDKLIEYLEKCDTDIVASNYLIYSESDNTQKKMEYKNITYGIEYKFEDICSDLECIQMHSMFYKTSVLAHYYKPLDINCFYVDTEHVLYPLVNVTTISFFFEAVYVYRIGDTNQSVSLSSYIKNRNQLKHVIFSLCDYYEKEKSFFGVNKKKYIKRRIIQCTDVLYSIIIRMPYSKDSKKEIILFDRELFARSNDIYYGAQLRIKFLRKLNFIPLLVFHWTINFKHIILDNF